MNSADQLKNWTSASFFISGGMPLKSPTMLDSMVERWPPRALTIAMIEASP